MSASGAAATGAVALPRVIGTWDFKWPRGSKLRVAFRQSEERGEAVARRLVKALAGLWNASLPGLLTLECDDGPLQEDGRPYDILMSFEPLPVTSEGREILELSSAVGRYARRVEYAEPTMYVGKPASFTDKSYFHSRDFLYHVMHGLSHALGLPHAHQRPPVHSPAWRASLLIRQLGSAGVPSSDWGGEIKPEGDLGAALALVESEGSPRASEVAETLDGATRGAWHDSPAQSFSDWPEVKQQADGCFDFESFTLPPSWWDHVTCPQQHPKPASFFELIPDDRDGLRTADSLIADIAKVPIPAFDVGWLKSFYK